MQINPVNFDNKIVEEWRELGFYYDFDDRLEVYQWRFYGSKKGLKNLSSILIDYSEKPQNELISEHYHLGPYSYLKIMTWNKPTITENYFAGSVKDIGKLGRIILGRLAETLPGQTFSIDKEYGIDNTTTTKFFVMDDYFDPALMDELIVSDRQKIINKAK